MSTNTIILTTKGPYKLMSNCSQRHSSGLIHQLMLLPYPTIKQVLIVVEQVVEKSSSPSPKKMFRHRNMMEFYEYTDYLIE